MVKQKITLLRGDSATGKTELLRLIRDHEENGRSSGITIKCDCVCTVLTNVDWERRIQSLQNHIIFIDETAVFLKLQRFAALAWGDPITILSLYPGIIWVIFHAALKKYMVSEIWMTSKNAGDLEKCVMKCSGFNVSKSGTTG